MVFKQRWLHVKMHHPRLNIKIFKKGYQLTLMPFSRWLKIIAVRYPLVNFSGTFFWEKWDRAKSYSVDDFYVPA